MSQLYARVFCQILDSSIAEDFTLRHIFEDLLKLADSRTGVVDMTRQAMARRLNIPVDMLDTYITKLESPDPASRDPEFDGRRIQRLNEHRDWGWQILNWRKYDDIRTRADVAIRVQRSRDKKKAAPLAEIEIQIYDAYPRKVARPKAIEAIRKALEKIDGQKLLRITRDFATRRGDTEPQFIPHPTTWFNQERYNDDPSTWLNTSTEPKRAPGWVPDSFSQDRPPGGNF